MRTAPSWATHKALFCGIVPVWFADEEPDGCVMEGRGFFADNVLLPVITFAFGLAALAFGWELFPIRLTETLRREEEPAQ